MSRHVLLARKLDQGGAERQIVTLVKALRERGREVHVVLFYAGGAFDGELAAAGVPVQFVGKRGRWDVFGFLIRLALILRRLRPTTIYSFLDLPNLLTALLRPVVWRSRLVWSIRAAGMEMQYYDWLSRLISRLEALLSQAADVIVANSHAGKAWAISRGFPQHRIVVIENGIDTERFRFDAAGRERVRDEWKVSACETAIGIVARLDAMKDHRNFLQACALLEQRRNNLRFICVGSGDPAYQTELNALAQTLGIADRVIWAGSRADMPAVLSALDIAVSSSSFGEGFSNAIAEAMACERPCVVTDVGDSARIVGDRGEVALPRDANALAGAIARMLDRIEENVDIGRQARSRIVKEFSVERMVSRTEQVLLESL
ncbi:MAG TPA: glycosyltransferase [Nitrospiraceae bacterium]|jgi:glycosyltransferase involved in cell wall biosynthesis|nr:glycosyltransferase [Nitrospiraceae bacterium]